MGKHRSVARIDKMIAAYADNKRALIKELKLIVKEGQESGDKILIGSAYHAMAISYYKLGDKDGIFTNALKATAMLKDTEEFAMIAKAYITLGYAYFSQENNQMAFESFDRAYQIIKKHRIRSEDRIYVLNNLSNCYHFMGDCKTGIKLLTECLERTKKIAPEDFPPSPCIT